jgi:TP901 family phage tail tape measure protein
MGLLGEMTVRFGMDVSGLQSGAQQATGLLGALSSIPMGGVIAGVAAVGGAAIAMGAATVSAASDFQTSMLKVQAYAGLSKQQTDSMSQSLMQMATQVGQSPKQLADAIYPIVSSGYQAADALNILKQSAETAAASGAQTSVVADGLTTVLKTFGFSADKAGSVMDVLNKTVSQGKTSFPELASVIGKLSSSANGAKVPFVDMNAALDTLTVHGFPSTAQASNALGNLFTQIGVKTDALAKNAQALGLKFDAQKFSAMSLGDKIQYLNTATGGNQAALLKMLGGSTLALKAFDSLSSGAKDYNSNLAALNKSQGATASAFQTASQGYQLSTQKMGAAMDVLKVSIGNALLPALTNLVSGIAPIISNFATWLQSSGALQATMQIFGSIISNISKFLGSVFTPIIQTLVGWFSNTQGAVNTLTPVFNTIWYVIQGIGQFLASTFTPVWQQLVAVFQSQLVPAWGNLIKGMAPIMPQLQQFAMLIGGVVLLAISLVTGAIGGLLSGLAGFFTGFAMVVGGIVTYISGAIEVISGIIAFFVDLFTGHFDKLGGDLGSIWNGVVTMFTGVWQIIQGVFVAAINMIIGLINGFVAGALGPINTVLKAAGQTAIAVGKIPMLAAPSATKAPAAPAYKPATPITSSASGGGMAQIPPGLQALSPANINIPAIAQQAATGATTAALANAGSANVNIPSIAQAAAQGATTSALSSSATSNAQQMASIPQAAATAASSAVQTNNQNMSQILASPSTQEPTVSAISTATSAISKSSSQTAATEAQKKADAAKKKQEAQAAAGTQQIKQQLQQPMPVKSAGGSSTAGGIDANGNPIGGATANGQQLTIIVELDGTQIAQYIGNAQAKIVRLRTGRKA